MDPETGLQAMNSEEKLLAFLGNGKTLKDYYARSKSHPRDELQDFRTSLLWLGLDQSSPLRAAASWLVFVFLTIAVPIITILAMPSDSGDPEHRRPYNNVVQISQSVVATVAFFCLSRFVKKYGLRRFLFLDALCDESSRVASGYVRELSNAFQLLAYFLLPCVLVDVAMKAWWYATEKGGFPQMHYRNLAKTLLCTAEIVSRLYRTAVFFLVCVLFRLTCYLQILRFHDFLRTFRNFHDGSAQAMCILKDHLRIKHHLRVISHRFRLFIVAELLCVTFTQFVVLFLTTEPKSKINVFTAFDLAICSVVLMTGLVIVLQSAAKITHKALGVKVVATRWHALATCNSNDEDESESPCSSSKHRQQQQQKTEPEPNAAPAEEKEGVLPESEDYAKEFPFWAMLFFSSDSDGELSDDADEDEQRQQHLNFAAFCRTEIASFQKRQALVKYLEHNNAGITVFGFVLDRSSLHMVFGVELSLALFILGKTISISA